MTTFGYKEMQAELRKLNREIGKIAKKNADSHQEERKISRVIYTPKETMRRIREKAKIIDAENHIQEQTGPRLIKTPNKHK